MKHEHSCLNNFGGKNGVKWRIKKLPKGSTQKALLYAGRKKICFFPTADLVAWEEQIPIPIKVLYNILFLFPRVGITLSTGQANAIKKNVLTSLHGSTFEDKHQ